jgi:hypothetical protein
MFNSVLVPTNGPMGIVTKGNFEQVKSVVTGNLLGKTTATMKEIGLKI